MPSRRSKSNNKTNKRNRGGNMALVAANPSPNEIIYRGPLRTNQAGLIIADVAYDSALTSNGSGTIAVNYTDDPSGSPDWTSFQNTYSEYRTLSMTVIFTPNVTGATIASVAYAPIYVIWDAVNTATPLASYADATNYPSLQVHSINVPFRMSHRMSTVDESTFAPTSTVAVDYVFKYFATGLTNSTSYGRITVLWHCQFRGRK